MWVEQLANGKFRYAERFVDPVTGKSRKVSVVMEKNTKQSERLARELLREKMNTRPAEMTLSKLVDLYLEEQKQTVKASTRSRNTFALGTIVKILDDVRLDKLTAGYIRQRFLATGEEPGRLNERLIRLKALLRWGYKYDYIADIRFLDKLDPFKDTPHRQKIQDKFLEREELETLIDSMRDDVWKDLTWFLALSGLRYGEAAALTRKDIDLENRVIIVNKTYDHNNHVVTSPKTYQSMREVYMQTELYDLCRRILFEDNILYMSDLFFVKNGKRVNYDNFRIYLRKHSLKVLERVITPHTLRHTHASLLMEAGVDIDTISERLGHSDSQVTREIYLHVTEKLKEQRNERIRDIKIMGI